MNPADSVCHPDSDFDSYFVVGVRDCIDHCDCLEDLADSNAAAVVVVVAAAAATVPAADSFDHVPDEKGYSYFADSNSAVVVVVVVVVVAAAAADLFDHIPDEKNDHHRGCL